jgi:hypothetical protein
VPFPAFQPREEGYDRGRNSASCLHQHRHFSGPCIRCLSPALVGARHSFVELPHRSLKRASGSGLHAVERLRHVEKQCSTALATVRLLPALFALAMITPQSANFSNRSGGQLAPWHEGGRASARTDDLDQGHPRTQLNSHYQQVRQTLWDGAREPWRAAGFRFRGSEFESLRGVPFRRNDRTRRTYPFESKPT